MQELERRGKLKVHRVTYNFIFLSVNKEIKDGRE
jgi:hypothetical protein